MEFKSYKVIKGVDVVDGKVVGSYLINRVSGNRIEHNGAEFGVSYFIKSGIMRKKAYFDSSDATVICENDRGLEFAVTKNGIDWKVFVEYVEDEISGVLRKFITIKASDSNVKIDYIQLDGFSTFGPAGVHDGALPAEYAGLLRPGEQNGPD